MNNLTHIICLSGGHSSGLVAIEVARKYGKENILLLNHDINPRYETEDIKQFKKSISDYIGVPITYANYNGQSVENIPSQFEICVKDKAITDIRTQQALCTSRLKTDPFYRYLEQYFYPVSFFGMKNDCIVYYGFDKTELVRIQRRSSIMAAKGYKTDYPLALWEERTIQNTEEIGIPLPTSYTKFVHANCIGCLKASLLHWYVVYCDHFDIYEEGVWMENEIDFTVHTVIRNKVKMPISLEELAPIYERMRQDGIEATEHQSKIKFANDLRKYQLQECDISKPCECLND